MAKMIHSMIRVLNDKTSIEFYNRAFGLKVKRRKDFDDFSLIYLASDEDSFELELTVNNDRTTPYNIGDGYGHLAIVVEDLKKEHKRLTELGFAPEKIVEFKHEGTLMATFFFMKDPDGYSIEVLKSNGKYK
jgi:lactoylglutathione lyase